MLWTPATRILPAGSKGDRDLSERKKVILFTAADPRSNPEPIWRAYHWASTGTRAGLDCEVRLAGDAVRVARDDDIADTPDGRRLREKVREARTSSLSVSL